MQRALQRQLCALFLGAISALGSEARPVAAKVSVAERLQALRWTAMALGAREAKAEEYAEIEKAYVALEKEAPLDAGVRNEHGEFWYARGEKERAVRLWSEAERMEPQHVGVLRNLSSAALEDGRTAMAAGYLERVVAIEPQNARGHFDLANLLFLFRNDIREARGGTVEEVLQKALAHFREASRCEPESVEFARGYAETFFANLPAPDWQAALGAWEHLTKILPQKDFGYAGLVRVHLRLGNKVEARACLERITSAEFATVRRRLERNLEGE